MRTLAVKYVKPIGGGLPSAGPRSTFRISPRGRRSSISISIPVIALGVRARSIRFFVKHLCSSPPCEVSTCPDNTCLLAGKGPGTRVDQYLPACDWMYADRHGAGSTFCDELPLHSALASCEVQRAVRSPIIQCHAVVFTNYFE